MSTQLEQQHPLELVNKQAVYKQLLIELLNIAKNKELLKLKLASVMIQAFPSLFVIKKLKLLSIIEIKV